VREIEAADAARGLGRGRSHGALEERREEVRDLVAVAAQGVRLGRVVRAALGLEDGGRRGPRRARGLRRGHLAQAERAAARRRGRLGRGGLRVDDVLALRAAHRERALRDLRVVELQAGRALLAGDNHD
jgi:hypothetical protein